MRMSGGLPCACPRGYHAHGRGRTMRMSGGVPCACQGVYHAHVRGLAMRMSGVLPCLGVAQGMARGAMSKVMLKIKLRALCELGVKSIQGRAITS